MSSFSAENSTRKPKFTRTCSMLSQYLKQNGSFGDLSRGMTCNNPLEYQKEKTPITMNLLPTDGFSAKAPVVKPMDLFPLDTGFVRILSMKEPVVETVPAEVVVEATQDDTPLTIFYAGKVLVFDKLPKEKAKEILDYADVISTKSSTPLAGNDQLIVNPSGVVDLNSAPLASDVPAAVSPGICSPVKATLVSGEEKICKQNHVPIARKASLHRFLEKRKDRIIAKAPYQVVNNTSSSTEVSTKPEPKKKSWLDLASSMPPPPPRLQLQL